MIQGLEFMPVTHPLTNLSLAIQYLNVYNLLY